MRLNLLHQGAAHLSCQSKGINDGYAKLARRYVKLFKDVLKTERVKIQPGIGRTFCRKCKQMFVAKVERCKLNFVQRKVMQRTYLKMSYEAISELLQDVSLTSVEKGTAPVKAEFLIKRSNGSDDLNDESSTTSEVDHERENSTLSPSTKKDDRKSRRGMNKTRRKEMKQAET
nr:RNAse P domain containing protein [Haemonchus contortus]